MQLPCYNHNKISPQEYLDQLSTERISVKVHNPDHTSYYLTPKTKNKIRLFAYNLNGRDRYDLLLKKTLNNLET